MFSLVLDKKEDVIVLFIVYIQMQITAVPVDMNERMNKSPALCFSCDDQWLDPSHTVVSSSYYDSLALFIHFF